MTPKCLPKCLIAGLLAGTMIAPAAGAAEPGKPPITAQTMRSGGVLNAEQAKLVFDTADLAFEVFPETETLAGVATLNFTARAPVDRLVIDLDRNLPVSAIAINGIALAPGAWSNPQGRMTIRLPRRVAKGGKIAARISYGGTPHVAIRPPWQGGFMWAKTPAGAPWIATAVQGEGCDMFWPCIDHPTFEPERIDLHLTVPKGLKGISNGVLARTDTLPDGRTIWHWSIANPTIYGIALNVAPYEVVKGSYQSRFGNSVAMEYWYLPGEKAQAEALFAEFAPTLDFFEATIGPYPFGAEKVGVVETPHLGMEHQTINAYGNKYRKSADGFDSLFHHEFAHEWFANQLTVADWDDFWLHEGYGAYMQPLYGRWRDGEARYATMMESRRNSIANKFAIVSGSPKTEEEVYKPATGPAGDIYVKGAWMLHTLRNLIGDKAFFEVTTRAVYGRPDPKPGNFKSRYSSSAEYRRIVDQVTGSDYGWFFDVYLNEAALPELVETRTGNALSLTWKTPRNRPFPLPVEVQVDGQVQRLAMTGGKDTLTVPEGARVVVDPMSRILKRSKTVEAFQAWQATQPPKTP